MSNSIVEPAGSFVITNVNLARNQSFPRETKLSDSDLLLIFSFGIAVIWHNITENTQSSQQFPRYQSLKYPPHGLTKQSYQHLKYSPYCSIACLLYGLSVFARIQ